VKNIYCCPKCRSSLSLNKKYYFCKKCKDVYPMYLNFPVFLTNDGDFYNLKKILIKDIFKNGNKFT
tara:strand:+ start:453 stop:650 length:198 start_codon:yes stop_codon:yes gene_type:complete